MSDGLYCPRKSRSTIGGGRGCHKSVPILGEDSTKIAPPGVSFDQPPREMSGVRGKLADHVGDHVVLFCFSDLPGDGIVVSPPPPIVETLGTLY